MCQLDDSIYSKGQCDVCPMNGGAMIRGEGNTSPDFLIVGDNPTAWEQAQKKPLHSKGGKIARFVLDQVGITDRTYFTHVMKCTKKGKIRKLLSNDIALCNDILQEEIAQLKPKVIIPMGEKAITAITGQRLNPLAVQGKVWWNPTYNAYVVPVIHPVSILHVNKLFRDFVDGISRAKIAADMEPGQEGYKEPEYHVVDTISEGRDALRWLLKNYPNATLAMDVETDSFNSREGSIIAFGVCYEPGKVVIFDENVVYAPELRLLWKRFMEQPGVRYGWQNGKFDIQWFFNFGKGRGYHTPIDARVDEDTMLMHFLIDERRGSHDLKQLGQRYLGTDNWDAKLDVWKKEYCKAHKIKQEEFSYRYFPKDMLFKYLAYDVDVTMRLIPILHKEMDEEDVWWPYRNLMIRGSNHLARFENHGMFYNKEYYEKLQPEYEKIIEEEKGTLLEAAAMVGWDPEAYAEARTATRLKDYKKANRTVPVEQRKKPPKPTSVPTEFNPGSPYQLQYLIYDVMKLPSVNRKKPRTTDKDALKMWLEKLGLPTKEAWPDAEVLKQKIDEWCDKHPKNRFLYVLADYRKKTKLYSTYILGTISRVENDGRIHPTFLLHGTETGRLASRNPNAQNIPRGPIIKTLFKARPGYKIIQADFSQAELRVLAVISDDVWLQGVYYRGEDMHDSVSREMYGENFTKEQRVRAKALNFGIPLTS